MQQQVAHRAEAENVPFAVQSGLVFGTGGLGGTYIDDHADGGEGSSQVLRVGGSHGHRDHARIQAAIEGSDQVNTWRRRRREQPGRTSAPFTNHLIAIMDELTNEKKVCVFVSLFPGRLPGG